MDFSDPVRRETARAYFEENRAAMEEGTQVLWREKEDYEDLVAQLTLQGRRAFYQEKQNTPLGATDAIFDTDRALRARYIQDEWQIHQINSDNVIRKYPAAEARRIGYLDTAMGKKADLTRGDFSAIATVLVYTDGTIILEDLWARRAAPSAQVARIFDRHEAYPYDLFAIEGIGFQELLLSPIEEEKKNRRRDGRRVDLHITAVHPKKSKIARISALEPLLANGTLALASNLDEEFWEELANYPRSDHDDALDALAGAIQLAREHQTKINQWETTGKRIATRRTSY